MPDERLVTSHVLAMEYLRGPSLAFAIEEEMEEVASALGMKDGSQLRASLMRQVQQHFEGGGGSHRFLHAAEAAAPLIRAYAKVLRLRRRLCTMVQARLTLALSIGASWLGWTHAAHRLEAQACTFASGGAAGGGSGAAVAVCTLGFETSLFMGFDKVSATCKPYSIPSSASEAPTTATRFSSCTNLWS